MAAQAPTTTIKLPAPLLADARAEAGLMNRSMGSQVEHWALLGRAVERAQGFTLDRIRAAMAGEFDAAMLTESERDYFDDMIGGALSTPKGAGREFWDRFDRSRNTDR